MRLLHGSNVAVKKPDLKWCQSKNDFGREFPKTYLEDKNREIFIQRVSQFGSSYVQYCFCTEKALTELITL